MKLQTSPNQMAAIGLLSPPNPAQAEVFDQNLRPQVIVADDDVYFRRVLSLMLIAKGYNVRCVDDGEAGWESPSAEPFDLLITDYEMPRLSGLNLLHRMRETGYSQPVILMSGNLPQAPSELKRFLTPGAALSKPFCFTNLLLLMETLIKTARSA